MTTLSCYQCQQKYTLTKEEVSLYEKFHAPHQNLCFTCNQINRLCFRNERTLYHRTCDGTGEQIISIYSPDKPYKIYKSEYWYGDQWDGLEYGQEFDFSRPFFDQLLELQAKIPRLALLNAKGENSDYCNMTFGNKNCYLVFGGDFNEDTLYGTLCMNNRSIMDSDYSNQNELCYMMSDSLNCYNCYFTFDSKSCRNCHFISDCINCSNCILCTNLVNKSYCINNQQFSKEKYFELKDQLLQNGSYQRQQKCFQKFKELRKHRIVKYAHFVSCQNCTGDYINNSKSCHNCYDTSNSEDLQNVIFGVEAKDCFNTSLTGHKSELVYEGIAIVGANNCRFCYFILDSNNIEYSELIVNSSNLFGCVGLNHKSHCILNKQHTPEGYETLRKKIIEHMKKTGEWGKFFPKNFSAFGYNETTAHDYFPMEKEAAQSIGFNWHEETEKEYKPQTIQIPNTIQETPDTILQEILACEECKRNFKIVSQELSFYKQLNIPIPHKCHDCRHQERMSLHNPRKTWARSCAKCNTPLITSYAPNRSETIYCENCYLQLI